MRQAYRRGLDKPSKRRFVATSARLRGSLRGEAFRSRESGIGSLAQRDLSPQKKRVCASGGKAGAGSQRCPLTGFQRIGCVQREQFEEILADSAPEKRGFERGSRSAAGKKRAMRPRRCPF